MKKIIFLLLLLTFYAGNSQNYENQWAKVIEYENDSRLKSANEEVDKIYKKAESSHNEVQLIKTFFYKSKYAQTLEEDSKSKIISNLQKQIQEVSTPSKAILNLIYAKILRDYKQSNHYIIERRTQLDSTENADFLTWTLNDFESIINKTYSKSLENEAILKRTPLSNYEQIFDFFSLENFNSTTLYDYVLKENIDHYKYLTHDWEVSEDIKSKITKPLLGLDTEFKTLNFDSISDNSIQKVVQLYQKTAEHSKVNEMDLDRILFCEKEIIKDKDLLIKALDSFQKRTDDPLLIQKVQYEKAMIFERQASKEKNKFHYAKAVVVLDSILSTEKKSNAFKKATQKKYLITLRELDIEMQGYSYEKENTRAFVSYKNIDSIKISFYKAPYSKFNAVVEKDSIVNDFISKNKAYLTKTYRLINHKDYFEYTTEIVLPNLEIGNYIVVITDLNDKENQIRHLLKKISVSNISMLAHESDSKVIYQALNRKSGKPIENCILKFGDFSIVTNDEGIAQYNISKENKTKFNENRFHAIKDNDTIPINKTYFQTQERYNPNANRDIIAKVRFYLDRAIYRPGQTVYFKGIAIQRKSDIYSIISGLSLKVIIRDANSQEVQKLNVITNEFGSFSSEFVIPKNSLTGNYTIVVDEPDDYENDSLYNVEEEDHPVWSYGGVHNTFTSFKVEEYKRPKFEVNFNPVKETFTINQNVTVNGNAKAFAGSSISNAEVEYTVVRETFMKWEDYWPSETETISTSNTKTDATGNFIIDFIAVPDDEYEDETDSYFSYKVTADVTDINGETHSNTTTIKVGSKSMIIKASIDEKIISNNKNSILLSSKNLNNHFVPIEGEVKIFYLKPFENKFKNRKFKKPEIESIPKNEFDQLFPYENNEDESEKNTKGEMVFSKKVNTDIDKKIDLDFIAKNQSGDYRVEFSAIDTNNKPLNSISFFKLFHANEPNTFSDELITITQLNQYPKIDGFVKIRVNSAFPNMYVSCIGYYENTIFYEKQIQLSQVQNELTIPISKGIKNKFEIVFEMVYENQYHKYVTDVYLKEELPKITFDVESFRDKLVPGANETWSFKIRENNLKTEMEVLATMYDSSLDQFVKKDWDKLISTTFSQYNYYGKSKLAFETVNFNLNFGEYGMNKVELRNEETKLIWFGFDFISTRKMTDDSNYKSQLYNKSKMPDNAFLISGIVSDAKGALPGANVVVKGTLRGVQTDMNGRYEIHAAKGEQLVFSFIGMHDKKVTVSSKIINVILEANKNVLQEVVVEGYRSTSKKKSLAYSTTSVSVGSDLAMAFEYEDNAKLIQSFKGQVPGLEVNYSKNSTGEFSIKGTLNSGGKGKALYVVDGVILSEDEFLKINPSSITNVTVLKETAAIAIYGSKASNGAIIITTNKGLDELSQVKTRTNRNETAFFFPRLKTDKEGKIQFQFNSPEELTQWKFRMFAHTKNANIGYYENRVLTQKELMIFPNMPRFFRERDTIQISAKVANLTAKVKNGNAMLQLYDASTMERIDNQTLNTDYVKNFSILPSGNSVITWRITIPEGIHGIQYKIVAKSDNYSDGEESIIPVLTNRMLVTESIPIWVRENSKKTYTFDNLKNNTSNTLKNHLFTIEYTSNPTWLAIQSLPYIMEYEHECAEQTFARFYATILASRIINSNPKIANVFENWKNSGKLISKLEENEELKSLVLAETPWLKDAESEEEKKKSIALLFDFNKMKLSIRSTYEKLKDKQKSSGGFAWFEGGLESKYITRHIITGLGHLNKLRANQDIDFTEITYNGLRYLDKEYEADYERSKKSKWHNSYNDMHYLYMRSFFLDTNPISEKIKTISTEQIRLIKADWETYSLYNKGMAALILHRFGETASAKTIIESLKETSSNNEDWGMYWIENKAGWYWHQAPIEIQALLIEAFTEVNNDMKSADAMKVWLLKNKQTKNWPTTKSTTEAIYALLLQGSDWLSVKDNTIIKLGDKTISTKKLSENDKEAETGYIKTTWKQGEITNAMSEVSIENKSKVPGYGGIYWNYFEDLDKIKINEKNNLQVSKELYLKKNTIEGPILTRITPKNQLQIGDLVTVRLIISSVEDMEYIHLKDMRASCFEPVNVLSKYEQKDLLSYYMSTKDAATHFFFDRINKGTYVLEYDIRVNNSGNFSNGITSIESMYAPEFTSHSKGIRIEVK